MSVKYARGVRRMSPVRMLVSAGAVAALTVASAVGAAGAAQAAVGVCPTTETDLSSAIDGAGDGGTVTLWCAADTTITFSSALTISSTITLDASGSAGKVILDGGGKSQVFAVATTGALALTGLTVAHGYNNNTPGGAIRNLGSLTVTHSTFSGNESNGCLSENSQDSCNTPSESFGARGGAIDNDGGTLTVSGSTFADNTVVGSGVFTRPDGQQSSYLYGQSAGGAINNLNGTVTIDDTTFSGNTATGSTYGGNLAGVDGVLGGAVSGDGGTTTISRSTFTANTTQNDQAYLDSFDVSAGGAVGVRHGTLEVTGSTFTSNRADGRVGDPVYALGVGGAAAAINDGALTIRDSTITDSYAQYTGQAVGTFRATAPMTLDGVSIASGPDSTGPGGDIGAHESAAPTVSHTTFAGATHPAIDLYGTTSGSLALDGLRFSGYHTSGGVIQLIPQDLSLPAIPVTISNSIFTDNTSSTNGGAMSITGGTITNSTFENNTATGGSGGAIYSPTGDLTIKGSTFTGNTASNAGVKVTDTGPKVNGGGAVFSGGHLSVSDSTFTKNSGASTIADHGWYLSFGGGGAILAGAGLQVERSTFSGNTAPVPPGVIYGGSSGGAVLTYGTATIADSVLDGNTAYSGGAVWTGAGVTYLPGYTDNPSLTVTNSTLTGNHSTGSGAYDGGGSAVFAVGSSVSLRASTIVGNTGVGDPSSDGPLTAYGRQSEMGAWNHTIWTIGSSIVQAESCDRVFMQTFQVIDKGYNASDGTDWCSTDLHAPLDPTDHFGVDLKLDPAGLADNGGPTKTIALQPDSPAVGAIPASSGMCQATDQRGAIRTSATDTTCDIGAFELNRVLADSAIQLSSSGTETGPLAYQTRTGKFTLTATVSGGASSFTPTGTVTFALQSSPKTPVCTQSLPAQAPYTVSCVFDFSTPSTVPIVVTYGGDLFLASTSASPVVTVLPPASTTKLTATTTHPHVGAVDTYTATVAGSQGVDPSGGTVTFTDEGGTVLCAAVALSSAKATCDYAFAAAGAHTVTATYDGGTTLDRSSGDLGITAEALTSIAVTPSKASVPAGLTQQFTATGTYADGTSAELTSGVTWSSSDPADAAIDESSGLAVGRLKGTTVTVTATVGSITGSTTLDVTDPVPMKLTVAPDTLSLPKGVTAQVTATMHYSDGSTADVTGSAAWSTSAGSVATVSGGAVTAAAQGSATITAMSGSLTATVEVGVTPAVPKSVSIAPSSLRLAKGTTGQLTATATYTDGTTVDVTATAQWSSSATGVATVSGGTVSAVAAGTAVITVKAGAASTSITVTVTTATLQSITVTPSRDNVPLGTTASFTASGTFSDGTVQDLTRDVQWSSSSTRVATVDDGGVATTKAQGSTTVTATFGQVSGSAHLIVAAPARIGIAIVPGSISLAKGSALEVAVMGVYTDGSAHPVSPASLVSSDPAVARLTGVRLTAVADGSATLTATVDGYTATAKVVVKPASSGH